MHALIVFAIVVASAAAYPQMTDYMPYEAQRVQYPQLPPNYNQPQIATPNWKPVRAIPDARCPRTDDPARPVHLPMSGSCAKFMKCNGGLAFEMDCPVGLEFGVGVNRCDYPALAQCRH